MADITHDSELMKLHVAAIPVPPSRRFYTVRDEHGTPLVFSVGLDNVLYALKENSSGGRTLIDLGKALGIDETKETVSSLDVAQDWKTDDIYLTFTTAPAIDDQKDGRNAKYRLNVVRPFDPSVINAEPGQENNLKHLMVLQREAGGSREQNITKVFMADSKVAGAEYPEIMVAYVPLDAVHKSTDLARISFSKGLTSWHMASDFDLPENASDVVDICPAVSVYGPGYFTLYRIQGQSRLTFITTQKVSGFPFEVALGCPSDARALRTYRELGRKGYSGLLVGGEGLYHWASNEYLRAGQPGRLISEASAFHGVGQLDVAQSATSLSIFALNDSFGISYARVAATNMGFSQPLQFVSLVADGLGGAYSPFIDPEGLSQQVIAADKAGTLSLLSQDQATGYWESTPFYVPNPDKVVEFTGYMTRVTFTKIKGNTGVHQPLIGRAVVMRYPVYTAALVNGRSVTIGPSGTQVMTDHRGVLSFLIPSNGIAAEFVTLHDPGVGESDNDTIMLETPLEIDPTAKVFKRLATLATPQGLRDATLPSGKKLLANTNATSRDVEQYSNAMAALKEEREKLKAAETRTKAATNGIPIQDPPRSKMRLIASSSGWSGANFASSSSSARALQGRNIIQDGLEWIRDVASSIGKGIQWALHRIEDRLELWIERADRPGMRIFLGSLLELTEAATLIFQAIFDALDDFLEFLIAVFDLEAMAVAQRYTVKMANGALGIAASAIEQMQAKVTDVFNEITDEVENFIFPPELEGHGIFDVVFGDGASRLRKTGEALESETVDSSVKANYIDYQITHGGVGTTLNSITTDLGIDESMDTLYTTVIKPLLDDFVKLIEQAFMDLVVLSNDKDDISFGDALSRLTLHLVSNLLQVVEDVIHAILALAQRMLLKLRDVLNGTLDNPILNLITGRDNFSVMDLSAWILAPLIHFAYVIENGKGMPADNPLPDFAAAISDTVTDTTQHRAAKGAGPEPGTEAPPDDPNVYVNPSAVNLHDARVDKAAGILDSAARVAGLVETVWDGVTSMTPSAPTSVGPPSLTTLRARSAVSSAGKRLPRHHPRAQIYKFLGPDPLSYSLLGSSTSDSATAGSTGEAAGKKNTGGWIVVFFRLVAVIAAYPQWHGPRDGPPDKQLKLSPWAFSVIDLIGVVGLQVVGSPGKYAEPLWDMFWSFWSFWPSLVVAVRELKAAKKEEDQWPNETDVDTKRNMARVRLSLVFVDGLNAIAGGFLALDPEPSSKTGLGVLSVLTSVAGLAMLSTTVAKCWDLKSKNFLICVL